MFTNIYRCLLNKNYACSCSLVIQMCMYFHVRSTTESGSDNYYRALRTSSNSILAFTFGSRSGSCNFENHRLLLLALLCFFVITLDFFAIFFKSKPKRYLHECVMSVDFYKIMRSAKVGTHALVVML